MKNLDNYILIALFLPILAGVIFRLFLKHISIYLLWFSIIWALKQKPNN